MDGLNVYGFIIAAAVILSSRITCSQEIQNFEITRTASKLSSISRPDENNTKCDMKVADGSVAYFRGQLASADPNFIRFYIKFNRSRTFNETPETFRGKNWVWTYRSPVGLYPYLFWNIDYSLLSFGMLDHKTLAKNFFVLINVEEECQVTFGSSETTQAIGNALKGLTEQLNQNDGEKIIKYHECYYCFLAEAPGIRNTFQYSAAVYFTYPISYINYNCCMTAYNYSKSTYNIYCDGKQIEKWPQCVVGPYILAVIFFLYFPILLIGFAGWTVKEANESGTTELTDSSNDDEEMLDNNWVFLNEKSPYKFSSLFTNVWCGLNRKYPALVSRWRRLLFVLLIPTGLYIQIAAYYYGMPMDIFRDLIKHGTPMGFLSILGDRNDMALSFATAFGGALYVLAMYYSIGVLLLVVPNSVEHLFEIGMPSKCRYFKSPLCLSTHDVRKLSRIPAKMGSGYRKGVTLFTCGIYMLFSETFWKKALKIQKSRYFSHIQGSSRNKYLHKILLLPFYIAVCAVEILFCIVLYGVPFVMLVTIFIRGISFSIANVRIRLMHYGRNAVVVQKWILSNPLIDLSTIILIATLCMFFSYALSIIVIESFFFFSEVAVYCFVAVIVYPSVAFGNLFFVVIAIYNIARLIRNFGDGYLELLFEAVEISRCMETQCNHVISVSGNLVVSNVKATHVKSIRINYRTIPVAQNRLQSVLKKSDLHSKTRLQNHKYGIPRDLFHYLILKHRPPQEQCVHIVLRVIFIAILIGFTRTITSNYVSGSTSGISDVMHVIFIVTVGAFPNVIDVAFGNASKKIKRDIGYRRLEQLIVMYWVKKYETKHWHLSTEDFFRRNASDEIDA